MWGYSHSGNYTIEDKGNVRDNNKGWKIKRDYFGKFLECEEFNEG